MEKMTLKLSLVNSEVLILIIMEDTHGVAKDLVVRGYQTGLNPYYNGRYSWSYPRTLDAGLCRWS